MEQDHCHHCFSSPSLHSPPSPLFSSSEVFEHGGEEGAEIERTETLVDGRQYTLRSKAEGYMLFRKGVVPLTEFEVISPAGGKSRATQRIRRAELAVSE